MARKILIVDDEEPIRTSLAMLLEAWGFETMAVGGGRAAVKAFDSYHPEMVICDLQMHDGQGIEAIGEIRTRSNAVRIVAMSGGASNVLPGDPLEIAVHAGADAGIEKPFEASQLLSALGLNGSPA